MISAPQQSHRPPNQQSKIVSPDPKSAQPRSSKDRKPGFKTPPRHNRDFPPSSTLGEKLMVLTYGTNTNFVRWKEAMFQYLAGEYGQLACIFRTGRTYVNVIPRPDGPSPLIISLKPRSIKLPPPCIWNKSSTTPAK